MSKMKLKPRAYQQKFIDDARKQILLGKRKILCWLSTGSGKGLIIPLIAESALKNNKKVLFLVHGRSLVFQAKKKQFKHLESGLIMGSERGFNPLARLQIASIDTIRNKIDSHYSFLKEFDLILVDEAHQLVNDTYQNVINSIGLEKIYIGFTATPFPINGRVHSFWDVCLNPISVKELRNQGFLLDCKVLAPKGPDLSNVKISKTTKDFDENELVKVITGNQIIGDIVNKYKKYGNNQPAILFAVNVEHSKIMARAFIEAGIGAIHCDAKHNAKEREAAIKQLENGEVMILSNVDIFSTGTDIPLLVIGIMARPTLSEALFIQQAGRILRPYKICSQCGTKRGAELECPLCKSLNVSYEIQYAIMLDHAGNTAKHGGLFKDREPALDDKYFDRKKLEPKEDITTCPYCDYVLDEPSAVCPFCKRNIEKEKRDGGRTINEIDGELVQIDSEFEKRALIIKMVARYKQLDTLQKLRRWKTEFVYRKLHAEFGANLYMVADKIKVSTKFIDMLENRRKINIENSTKKVFNDLTYKSDKLIN